MCHSRNVGILSTRAEVWIIASSPCFEVPSMPGSVVFGNCTAIAGALICMLLKISLPRDCSSMEPQLSKVIRSPLSLRQKEYSLDFVLSIWGVRVCGSEVMFEAVSSARNSSICCFLLSSPYIQRQCNYITFGLKIQNRVTLVEKDRSFFKLATVLEQNSHERQLVGRIACPTSLRLDIRSAKVLLVAATTHGQCI